MNNKLLSFFSAAAIVLVSAFLANSASALEAITYFHNDISGTPLLATDTAGNVVWKEVYRPYGEKLNNQTASANNNIWFAGKPYDTNTGLSYMGARYYDPVIGRFTGVDPKDFDPNNIHSFNRYAYANNNPYKFVDPDGRVAVPAVFIGLGLVAVAIEVRSLPGQIQTVSRAFDAVRNAIRSDSAEAVAPADATPTPDVTKRPSRVRRGTEQANWDNAADGKNGGKLCPTCDGEVQSKPGEKGKDWDNDHVAPWRDRDLAGKDRKGVLDEYNNDTRLRCVGCNRSDNGSNNDN